MVSVAQFRELTPDQLRAAFSQFLPQGSRDERVATVEAALEGPMGPMLREEISRWIVDHIIPVNALVPRQYEHLRPLVADAMRFEALRLSAHRLAPKLVEQLELAPNTPPEIRLLRLIAKVPGLQKLGQVLSRNRNLKRSLRHALSKLENGIRDVKAPEIRAVIEHEFGPLLQIYSVEISSSILSEASVSAVMRFTWRDPHTRERYRGVFKVLKPHIPECFAEDMDLLHQMARYLGGKHREYGYAPRVIQDTFKKVRQLLEHEIDFTGEQQTLAKVAAGYGHMRGIAVPHLITHLCTSSITAMTEQPGTKVTNAARRLKAFARAKLAERLTEALVAAPLCAPEDVALFHGDPHAGNLLFDTRTGTLSLIDWALTGHLTADQRRHLALLVAMVLLRNSAAVCDEICALSQNPIHKRQAAMIRSFVSGFFENLPLVRPPQLTDAMQLLERISLKGVRFPASLIMFSKVVFMLDGILEDIQGGTSIGPPIARNFLRRWLSKDVKLGSPLLPLDWFAIGFNAAIYGSRVFVEWERQLFSRYTGLVVEPA